MTHSADELAGEWNKSLCYVSYLKGWQAGALGIDRESARDPRYSSGRLLKTLYDRGYESGCSARRAAIDDAALVAGYRQVLQPNGPDDL